MTAVVYLIVCLTLSRIVSDEAARILGVFPTPSISHQVVFRPLMEELARRGHQVVVITPDPAFPKGQAPANLTEIDVHDLSYKLWRENFIATATGKKNDLITQVEKALDLFAIILEKQIQTEEVQIMINDKTKSFDLLFVEACVRPGLGFSHRYKAPVILISSLGNVFDNYHVIGVPTQPLLFPTMTHQRLYNLTTWEKFKELYNHYQITNMIANHEDMENEMLRRNFGPDIPTLTELNNNIHMLFLNVHPMWEDNAPVPPTLIYMGGLHQKPMKELPKDIKTYLDSSKHGVIYMSFGTNTNPSLLPPEKIQMFVKVFSQLPYDILWKWDKDELPGRTKNIRIGKWFPQSDLLRHPKIKLFITQGGLQSTDEAITAGVPLIGIPMLGDQWYNVEKYVFHKIGVRLDLESLDEEEFRKAINTVIGDESYRHNIARLKKIMHDQPWSPLERATWWTEHVLRHSGATHLRSRIANMSLSEYYELELVFTILFAVLIAIAAIVILTKILKSSFLPNEKLKTY